MTRQEKRQLIVHAIVRLITEWECELILSLNPFGSNVTLKSRAEDVAPPKKHATVMLEFASREQKPVIRE